MLGRVGLMQRAHLGAARDSACIHAGLGQPLRRQMSNDKNHGKCVGKSNAVAELQRPLDSVVGGVKPSVPDFKLSVGKFL